MILKRNYIFLYITKKKTGTERKKKKSCRPSVAMETLHSSNSMGPVMKTDKQIQIIEGTLYNSILNSRIICFN